MLCSVNNQNNIKSKNQVEQQTSAIIPEKSSTSSLFSRTLALSTQESQPRAQSEQEQQPRLVGAAPSRSRSLDAARCPGLAAGTPHRPKGYRDSHIDQGRPPAERVVPFAGVDSERGGSVWQQEVQRAGRAGGSRCHSRPPETALDSACLPMLAVYCCLA